MLSEFDPWSLAAQNETKCKLNASVIFQSVVMVKQV